MTTKRTQPKPTKTARKAAMPLYPIRLPEELIKRGEVEAKRRKTKTSKVIREWTEKGSK